jgi:predicted DNA-binding protein with PD1-like motif
MEEYEYLEGTGHGKISRIVMGKLKMGVDLLGAVEELARKEHVKTGVILSGIGALERGVFRNLKVLPEGLKVNDSHRLYVDIQNPLELLSLSGWIGTTKEGELFAHCHFSASTVMDEKIVCLGGHLTKGTITSVKDVVVIGVIEDTDIRAKMDTRINQLDADFSK